MTAPTVFLVDDDAAVRDSLMVLLEASGQPAETYDSAEAFLAGYSPDRPGCLMLDLSMPGMNGLDLQAAMDQRGIRMPIIFLSAHGDVPTTVRAIKAGAVDFLTKPVDGRVVLERIQAALAKDRDEREIESRRNALRARLDRLTEQELRIFKLAAAGLQNKEVARRLGISHRTVESHRSRLLIKTGATSVFELANLVATADISIPDPD